MQKKILFIIVILTICIILISCSSGWKSITLDGVGSFKVPEDWIFTNEDGLIYFTDKPIDDEDCGIYLVEPIHSSDDKGNRYIYNPLFGNALKP